MEKSSYKNTPSIYKYFKSVIPMGIYTCKVLKVYDGDTIWVSMNFDDKLYKIKIRFNLIDTKEIRGGTDITKKEAYRSRDFVSNLILNKIIEINITDIDRYYRWLATIYPPRELWKKIITDDNEYNNLCIQCGHLENNLNLNQYMLDNNYADLYK